MSKNLFSLTSLLLNPTLHILSSVWQREKDGQRKREEEGERERERAGERERQRATARLLAGVRAVWTDTGECGEPSHL